MNSKYIYTSYIKKMAPVEDFDMEKFILQVRERDCIWDAKSKNYNLKCIRNRETKRRAWEEIAMNFHPNWDNLTQEDRQKKIDALSKKWANIRKYYTDEVRKPANSPPKKRQRRYHHLLTFLDESVQKKRVSRIKEFKNISKEKVNVESSSDSEPGELYIVEDIDELQRLESERADPTAISTRLDNKSNPDPNLESKREPDHIFDLSDRITSPKFHKENSTNTEIVERNPEIMKLLNERRGPPPINNNFLHLPTSRPMEESILSASPAFDQTAEASKRFLLSLLPEIMSLNEKQNLQFRQGIMELLKDIKLRVKPDVNPKLFPNIDLN